MERNQTSKEEICYSRFHFLCSSRWLCRCMHIKVKRAELLPTHIFIRQSLTLKTSVQVRKHGISIWFSTHTCTHVPTFSIPRRALLSEHCAMWCSSKSKGKSTTCTIPEGERFLFPYLHLPSLNLHDTHCCSRLPSLPFRELFFPALVLCCHVLWRPYFSIWKINK